MEQLRANVETVLARYVPRHILHCDHANAPLKRAFDGVLLMLDIAGFTALTETFSTAGNSGAEQLSGILNSYFGCMTQIAIDHGGDVLDVVGDALLVGWESQGAIEESGRLAVKCGLALQEALPLVVAQTGIQLRQRVSAASGTLYHIIVGGIGDKWHCLTTGAPLSEAAVANQHGNDDEVVICASLWAHLRGACVGRALPSGAVAVTRMDGSVAFPAALNRIANIQPTRLERYVLHPMLERLYLGGSQWLGEFRTVTILFVGIPARHRGVVETLSLLQNAMEDIQRIHAEFGGTPMRLSADDKGVSILTAFGLPFTAYEDDPLRAVITAQSIARHLKALGLMVPMGIATGPVFLSDSGGNERRHIGLTGSTVNRAARLMAAAGDQILCDAPTREAASHGIDFELQEPVIAKGLDAPVAVWIPGTRVNRGRRVFAGAIVGRSDELAVLNVAMTKAMRGESAVFALRGEAGIGKSRLITALAKRAQLNGMRVAWGAGYALESNSVFFPWGQILSQILSDAETTTPTEAREAAAAVVADSERLTAWLPLLNDLIPMQFAPTEHTRQMSSQARAASLRTLIVEFARRLAQTRPIVLVADDLHWFDGASAALLQTLASTRVPGLLMLVGTRPLESGAPQAAKRILAEAEILDLTALDSANIEALVAERCAATMAAPALLDFVSQRSAGNPLYAEEMILALQASGRVHVAEGIVDFAAGEASLDALPDGLRGIIVSRIDSLGAAEQLVLKIAAVIGREFSLTMLNDLLPRTSMEVDLKKVAAALQREDVVVPALTANMGFRFKHALLQETVYGQLPFALRQELHATVARWIELHEHKQLEPRYTELAQHWELALNSDAAIAYLEKSAALSLNRYANREAIALASHALKLSEQSGSPRNAVREARCEAILGDACTELFEYPAATRHFTRALASAGLPLPKSKFTLVVDLGWQLLIQLGTRAGMRRRIRHDPLLPWASHIHEKLGEIAYFDAGTLPLLHATLTSLNLAERSDSVREAVDGLAALSIGVYGAGLRWLSRVYHRRSLNLAVEKGGMGDIAYANLVSGVYCAAQGHWIQAEQSLQQSASLYTQLGAIERWQQAYGGLCAIDLMRGRFVQAQMWLDKLGPSRRDMPVQIAVYLHAFGTSLALATDHPLPEVLAGLQNVASARELAQFDRVLCLGLMAEAYWRLNERALALETALVALDQLDGRAPAAWYLTDGLAGIAHTLIEASIVGLVHEREAYRACKLLDSYARATKVAAPRSAWLNGRLALHKGLERKAHQIWSQGAKLAASMGLARDESLLATSLAIKKNVKT